MAEGKVRKVTGPTASEHGSDTTYSWEPEILIETIIEMLGYPNVVCVGSATSRFIRPISSMERVWAEEYLLTIADTADSFVASSTARATGKSAITVISVLSSWSNT